ncbi:MAG: tripartite tricarboxylate transporter substrate binding protein [Betaproteobacteria bacterium]|nr:tripartite tricarboxylate transporter substrate binding protein [Betaproteobacteria bacterium]
MNVDYRCLTAALAALPMLAAAPVAAQDYPAKIVRVIVPFPAGGSTDTLARMITQRLSENYGQNFIVENRPGATGTIASALVAKSAPDGHTLIMHSTSSYTAGFLYKKLPYDAARAFTPVIRGSLSGLLLVANASLPAKNIKELVALARQRPNDLTFGTVGSGSAAHLAAEMFNHAAGIKTMAVHFKGAAPALIASASGEVGFTVLNILDPQPFVKQGRLRALAVTGTKRSAAVPDVPTLIESGINVEANLWLGKFAPSTTPAAVISKLNTDIGRFLNEPKTNHWIVNNLGAEFAPHTPQQFAEFLARDTALWHKVIKDINLQLD